MFDTDHTLVLLAGAPGTGKTYTSKIIKESFPKLIDMPLDLFKEHIYDEIGFDNVSQKNMLDEEARQRFYRALDIMMSWEKPMIGDYPFSYKQKPHIRKLAEKYRYNVITVRLEADVNTLYERQRKRDVDEDRHPGHLMNHYHLGDVITYKSQADGMPSFETFKDRMEDRGYADFAIGSLIRIDVSDYSKIDYDSLIDQLHTYIDTQKSVEEF